MRIGIDMLAVQSPENRARGIGRYGRNLAAELARAAGRHELIFYSHGDLPTDAFPSSPQASIVRLPGSSAGSEPGALDRVVGGNRDALDAMLVLSPFEQFPWFMPPAPALTRLPLAAVVFDLIPLRFPGRYLADPGCSRLYHRRAERVRRYDALFAISESTRADAVDRLGVSSERVFNVGAAAEPGVFRPESPDESPAVNAALKRLGVRGLFVFSVAGDDPRKNLRGLIDAFALLPAGLRAAHRLVVTCEISAVSREALHAYAASRGLARGELVLTGAVTDDELRALYQRCAAFAFPSTFEGFGLPLL
jgi:glycosyltransferase involved in cell wall biosynthesis